MQVTMHPRAGLEAAAAAAAAEMSRISFHHTNQCVSIKYRVKKVVLNCTDPLLSSTPWMFISLIIISPVTNLAPFNVDMLSKEASCAGTSELAKAGLKIPCVSTTWTSGF
jgi:hypothetical protein